MENESENISDRELIRNCQLGNKPAFEKLVHRYYLKAYGIAIMKMHDPDLAFDISQEAFIRVFKSIKRFDSEKSFAPWLYKIVQNLCLNHLRRRKKRWIVFSDLFRSSDSSDNEPVYDSFVETDQFERNEQRAHLWRSLKRLDKSNREIIVLKDLQGFSYNEISEILSIPIGTVMSRLYYARKKMLKLLEEDE